MTEPTGYMLPLTTSPPLSVMLPVPLTLRREFVSMRLRLPPLTLPPLPTDRALDT